MFWWWNFVSLHQQKYLHLRKFSNLDQLCPVNHYLLLFSLSFDTSSMADFDDLMKLLLAIPY